MQPWKLIGEPETVKVGWRTLTKKIFEQPNGKQVEYTTFGIPSDSHGAVVALTPDNTIVIAEQFRPGPEKIMFELPGGGIEQGEDPLEAVMRELREETGYASDDVELLGTVHRDAYMNATGYYYLARNCKRVADQELDETEFIAVHEISIDELITNAVRGSMTDTAAVLMAYDKLKEIKEGGN